MKILIGTIISTFFAAQLMYSQKSSDLQWDLTPFGGTRRMEFRSRGIFYEFYISTDPHLNAGKFGPVSIWQPEGTTQLVMLSQSLSGLDEALRAEYLVDPENAINTIGIFINLYQGSDGCYFLPGSFADAFLRQMKPKVTIAVYEKCRALLAEPKSNIEEDMWEITIPIVTKRGAVERRTYSGAKKPLSIRKEVVEILAPAGTVPDFGYIQGQAENEMRNEQSAKPKRPRQQK